MILLLSFIKDIWASVGALLDLGGAVASQTEHIPQLEALPPVLDQIADEAVIQDRYMNALSQGYSESA